MSKIIVTICFCMSFLLVVSCGRPDLTIDIGKAYHWAEENYDADVSDSDEIEDEVDSGDGIKDDSDSTPDEDITDDSDSEVSDSTSDDGDSTPEQPDDADSNDDSDTSDPTDDTDSDDSKLDEDADSSDSQPDDADSTSDDDADNDSGDPGDSQPDEDGDTASTDPCNPNKCLEDDHSDGVCTANEAVLLGDELFTCGCESGSLENYMWYDGKCRQVVTKHQCQELAEYVQANYSVPEWVADVEEFVCHCTDDSCVVIWEAE